MTYVDTSVLVAYYCPEPLSEVAEAVLRGAARPAVSALAEVELFSAVARKLRCDELSRDDAGRICERFLAHLEAGLYERLALTSAHYQLARDWQGRFATPLRSLDALHLAVAHDAGRTTVTADERQAAAARALGVAVRLLAAA